MENGFDYNKFGDFSARVVCPRCTKEISIYSAQDGMYVGCPHCGVSLQVIVSGDVVEVRD